MKAIPAWQDLDLGKHVVLVHFGILGVNALRFPATLERHPKQARKATHYSWGSAQLDKIPPAGRVCIAADANGHVGSVRDYSRGV